MITHVAAFYLLVRPMRRSNGSIAPWSFLNGNKAVEAIVSGPFIANDFPTMLGAAVEGLGLAQVPEPIAAGPVAAGKTSARTGAIRVDGAGGVSLLSQPSPNDAEAAGLYRTREEPLGRHQQNPNELRRQAKQTAQERLMMCP